VELDRGLDGVGLGPEDENDPLDAAGGERAQRLLYERPATETGQLLRRAEAGAAARCEDDAR
jgi:hypothetical protein